MSWTDADPGQGNPDGLLALAADLQTDADDAASAARMLRGVQNNASDAVWKGSSANAFRDRIDKVPGHLDKLNASYNDAAAGIRTYAASVRQIADDARVQQQIISQSTGDLHTAQAQQAAWTPPPHPATGTPDPAAKNPHDDQVSAANASMKKAQSQLHDLAGQRKTADGTLVNALNHAHGEGMQNKHWWQKALDFVSDALSKITIVLMVVALVAIVVLAIVQPELIPGLLLLAGQVLTALSAAQLAVDGARKASGEDVSWGQLGMEALAALPGAGLLGKAGKFGEFFGRGDQLLSDASRAGALDSGVQTLNESKLAVEKAIAADDKIPVDQIQARLTEHTQTALQDYEDGTIRLSAKQQLAVDNGMPENLYKGQVLDKQVKALAGKDEFLQSRGIISTKQGVRGPDFLNPSRLPHEQDWYDVTTQRSWPSHVDKYTGNNPSYPKYPNYGNGGGILWDTLP